MHNEPVRKMKDNNEIVKGKTDNGGKENDGTSKKTLQK
jgi:hypothetical protein